MSNKAALYNRTVDFGLRIHVVVRETKTEAIEYAHSIISKLDVEQGKELRDRFLMQHHSVLVNNRYEKPIR